MERKKLQKKIAIVKKNITIRIAGKVSRYIDALMNRATPSYDCARVHAVAPPVAVQRGAGHGRVQRDGRQHLLPFELPELDEAVSAGGCQQLVESVQHDRPHAPLVG